MGETAYQNDTVSPIVLQSLEVDFNQQINIQHPILTLHDTIIFHNVRVDAIQVVGKARCLDWSCRDLLSIEIMLLRSGLQGHNLPSLPTK